MEQAYDYLSLAAASGEKPSFTTLVKERFYNDIVAEVELYRKCEKVDILPISIKKVIVTKHDIDEHNLYFDVIVNCALNENGAYKLIEIVVDAYFDLDEEFRIVRTRCACPVWSTYSPKTALPDDLIPAIPRKELDSTAIRMINILYPRAAKYAVPISTNQVVKRLGLTVRDVHFDSDEEIMAKIFFENASTIVLDPETGIKHIIPVSTGTILINAPIGRVADERIRNNTILHECVHWILHRPAFLLAKLWNREYAAVACRKAGSYNSPRQWTAIDRMEWQANALAPRMLMPDWATCFIAMGWLRRYDKLSSILRMEKTIDQLSRHFNVSRQLAKIRMEELGFEDAQTAFSFYDNRHHTISYENATRELTRNQSFRDTLASGSYAFVDDCFVIRDSKYICRDEHGSLHLTSYARVHMSECCLAFASRRINRASQNGMLRYNLEDESFIAGSGIGANELAKKTQAISSIMQELPLSFSDTLIAHMKRKGITSERLAEACHVSSNSISRLRREAYPKTSLSIVVSLCVGLNLHPLMAKDLVQKAGYSFNESLEHVAYQMILFSMTNNSLEECNDYLKSVGVKQLGTEE